MNEILKLNVEYDEQIGYYVTSRTIAEGLGKRHDHVLRDIENILKLENPNLGSLIIPSFYEAKGQKRKYKEYKLTKDGFTLYMFNIQGFVDFKMAYIQKFNEMERTLPKAKNLLEDIKLEDTKDYIVKRIGDRLEQAKTLEAQFTYVRNELIKVYQDIKEIADIKNRILDSKLFDCTIKEDSYDASKEEPVARLVIGYNK